MNDVFQLRQERSYMKEEKGAIEEEGMGDQIAKKTTKGEGEQGYAHDAAGSGLTELPGRPRLAGGLNQIAGAVEACNVGIPVIKEREHTKLQNECADGEAFDIGEAVIEILQSVEDYDEDVDVSRKSKLPEIGEDGEVVAAATELFEVQNTGENCESMNIGEAVNLGETNGGNKELPDVVVQTVGAHVPRRGKQHILKALAADDNVQELLGKVVPNITLAEAVKTFTELAQLEEEVLGPELGHLSKRYLAALGKIGLCWPEAMDMEAGLSELGRHEHR